MRSSDSQPNILIVADTAAAATPLAAVVHARQQAGMCEFTLLVPAVAHGLHRVVDPEDQCCAEAERTIGGLRPWLEAAAGAPVDVVIGSHEPIAAIQDALNVRAYTEVILATRASRFARWAHLDLRRKVEHLGVTVTSVDVRHAPPARLGEPAQVGPEPLQAA
jgi:hypothetical protein